MTLHTRHIIRFVLSYAFAIALSLFALCACSRAQDDAEVIPVEESDLLATDTIAPEPEAPKRLSFEGPEEILAYMDASPDSARYRRGIMRRLAETAPEYAESLLNSRSRRFIVCDKGKMKVFVYDSCGVEQVSYKMAAGRKYGNKHKKGDSRTPEGFFRVEGVYNSTEWLYTDDDGVTSQVKGQYGPRFIRIRTQPRRWPIGIHGTCAPWSVGGRRSHGCMRLSNDDILALVEYIDKGMPVIISPGTRDQRVNLDEGTPTRRIWTGGEPLAEVGATVHTAASSDTASTVSKDTAVSTSSTPSPSSTESAEPAPTPSTESTSQEDPTLSTEGIFE